MSDNLWDGNANCYAYSCNDPHAPPLLNGSACPGGIARQGVFARKGESEQDFAERLIKGVLLDGGHNNLVITVSRDIDVLPDAGPGYVTAMVSNATGYHFLRQDRETLMREVAELRRDNWTARASSRVPAAEELSAQAATLRTAQAKLSGAGTEISDKMRRVSRNLRDVQPGDSG